MRTLKTIGAGLVSPDRPCRGCRSLIRFDVWASFRQHPIAELLVEWVSYRTLRLTRLRSFFLRSVGGNDAVIDLEHGRFLAETHGLEREIMTGTQGVRPDNARKPRVAFALEP